MSAIAVPLQSEQVSGWKAWAKELTGARRKEWDEFNERMGLTVHRAWLMVTPKGPTVIAIHEGPGAEGFLKKLSSSKHPFDVWFRDNISKYHGIDFSAGPPAEPPQLVIDWHAAKAAV